MTQQYEVHYTIQGGNCGVVVEIVSANSDYQARRLIEARFIGQKLTIISTTLVRD